MKYLTLIILGLILAGCASFQEAYFVDREFGVASQSAWEQQVAYPVAPAADRVPMGIAGITAEEIMGVYNGTFAEEPMQQRVLSFGVQTGQ